MGPDPEEVEIEDAEITMEDAAGNPDATFEMTVEEVDYDEGA